MKVSGWVRSVLVAAVVLLTTSLYAQATRTWVSGVGDDVNPCSRTAPCKTWAGAISKTATGGIIDALDPGGYGALTITKAITVEGNGTLASGLHSGTNGFVINIAAGPTNRNVVLRNLLIDGSGTTLGLDGVRFLSGDSLLIEGCSIEQVSSDGIEFAPNSLARLTVRNTTITQALGNGINIRPAAGGTARVSIQNSTIDRNATGIVVSDANSAGSAVSIYRSNVTNNTNDGVFANSTTGVGMIVMVEDSEITHNSGIGLRVAGGGGAIRAANNLISGNGTGVSASAGELCSFLSNRLTANTANGAFTATCVPGNS
jgi:hypothetical protein